MTVHVDDPELALLTGPDAEGLLAAAVATAGGQLLQWTPRQVDHRPGSGTTVAYRARVRWADRDQDETLAASTALTGVAQTPGVLALSDGEREVTVWRYPLDPALPGLAAASDRRRVGELLTSFGVPGIDPDGTQVRLRRRAYRPRRRAVIEATSPSGRLFIKVLRPHVARDLHRRHVLLRDAGLPVPRSLGWSDDGLLVLQALTGTGLRQQLRAVGPAPSGEDLLQLLQRLPEQVLGLPHRKSWTDNVTHYARVVGATLPPEATRAADLAGRVQAAVAGQPADEPTHGDLYEAQLLMTGSRVTGLLDVDTAGPGRRADDVACLIAHLEVLGDIDSNLARPQVAAHLADVAAGWQAEAEQVLDARELRYRVAGVLMSLATGPHRVQDDGWPQATTRRLDLVQHWVELADSAR